jgi:hypothetical protein
MPRLKPMAGGLLFYASCSSSCTTSQVPSHHICSLSLNLLVPCFGLLLGYGIMPGGPLLRATA